MRGSLQYLFEKKDKDQKGTGTTLKRRDKWENEKTGGVKEESTISLIGDLFLRMGLGVNSSP